MLARNPLVTTLIRVWEVTASTGPCDCSHGILSSAKGSPSCRLLLQRGRAIARTESDSSSWERIAGTCFNGAVRLLARNHCACRDASVCRHAASTGPCDCSHGIRTEEHRLDELLCSFNGAVRLLARNLPLASTTLLSSGRLQRGRAIARTESSPPEWDHVPDPLRFNGAVRLLARNLVAHLGDIVRTNTASTGPCDCSHGINTPPAPIAAFVKLQRGRAIARTESLPRPWESRKPQKRFNGAVRLLARNRGRCNRRGPARCRFNGAVRLLARNQTWWKIT